MSQSRIKQTPEQSAEIQRKQYADRLKLAADTIIAARKVPDALLCDAIGESEWFARYCDHCLTQPLGASFLGCILLGWQMCEEYNRIKEATGIIYRA